ncbi:hypothetical protein J1N35_010915 [Gossypium stocksii]|uniref:Uncharacterized protein n=1 Tax=Gossypium stocksii TaxID=47602 RepID=A0A9D3W2I7_9ROSI|nr:hypothetical protein J1N35_010915 [Gossypium stocksii]
MVNPCCCNSNLRYFPCFGAGLSIPEVSERYGLISSIWILVISKTVRVSDNLEVGTEALTRVVREVLEKVFEASLERTREMVQGRYADYEMKRDRSLLRLEPRSAKHVRS